MHETPLLINVEGVTFDEYVRSLSKSARKNFTYAIKSNADLSFSRIPYQANLVEEFMDLWETQEAAGRKIRWGVSKEFIAFLHSRGLLICFAAKSGGDEEVLSLHFVEKHGDYVECHPPMFDKAKYNDRYLAKYMWFRLIEDAIKDPGMTWLDMGGGYRGTWRDLVTHREEWSNSYKWTYVPKQVKENPHTEKPFIVKLSVLKYGKRLTESPALEGKIKRYLIRKYVVWVWLSKGKRLQKLQEKLRKIFNRHQFQSQYR